MKKITSIIMMIVFVLSCFGGFTGCGAGASEPQEFYAGTHIQNIESTDYDLFNNGRTDYKIVIPANFNSNENLAAQEIVQLFKEGTGYTLSIYTDENLIHSKDNMYISIGETTLKEQAGITENEQTLGINGFAIKTVDKTIFIVGGKENGIVYGAYEFLYQILNFEQFFSDTYSLNTMVEEIPLMNYDIKELPDIKRLVANVGAINSNSVVARRMRMYYTPQNLYIWEGGDFTDTSFKILPPTTYKSEHSKWFSNDGTQLCYTAHGDPEELELMIQTYFEHLKQVVIDNPTKYVYKLADQDVVTCCQCEACLADYAIYKCASGSKIIFSNKVMDLLNDWFENDPEGQAHYNPDLIFRFNAYNLFEAAPVVYDETTDSYVPIDDKMYLKPGLGVEIAPVFLNYAQSYFNENNYTYYENMKKWEALFPEGKSHIGYWTYCFNADHFMYYFNTFDTMQEHYQIYASFGAESLFDQSQGNNYDGLTCWFSLKTYLQTKLAWNTNVNLDELTQRFFDNFYGEAASVMMEFFKSQRSFNSYQQEILGYCNTNYNIKFVSNKREYWPKEILESWRKIIDRALEKIEPIKTKNLEKYELLYKHIVAERVSIDFILLDLYKNQLYSKLDQIKNDFINEVKLNNISVYGEGSGKTLNNFINSL